MTKAPSPLSLQTKDAVCDLLKGTPTPQTLAESLQTLTAWRAKLLENTLRSHAGNVIAAGPFAGMQYPVLDRDEAHVPRLLGCYEASLQDIIEGIIAAAPPLIMDVGCGSGYYAIGFSQRLPRSTIWARDADPAAQDACQHLAARNNVGHRVKIGGKLTHADFDICRAQPTTILCNVGRSTESLLDPARAKGLARADVLVTVDEAATPGLTEVLRTRFAPTHHVTAVPREFSSATLPPWMQALSDADRIVALCEGRSGQTLWLWLQRKAH